MPKGFVDKISSLEWTGSQTWRGLTDWVNWDVSKTYMEVWRVGNEKVEEVERYENVMREQFQNSRIQSLYSRRILQILGRGHERDILACWWEFLMD